MDSFELNKIIGAILGTLLFVMGVGFLAEAIYEPIEGRSPGYELPEAEPAAASAEETAGAPTAADIGTLLASASADDGKAAARKCQSCHNFEKGGPNGQGPNLYGVVGRAIASHEGFNYSDAMKKHAEEVGNWTYQELNAFLPAPKDRVPGTKMNFAGVKDDQERANIIAFLSTLSDNPEPFPAPQAAVEQPTPGSEGAEPAATEANQTTSTPTETQSETPVAGTATGSNTPAGAETGSNASPAPSQPTAPAGSTDSATPTQGDAAAPAGQTPAPAGAAPAADAPAAPATTEAAPAATTTEAAPAAPAATATTTAAPAAPAATATTTTAPVAAQPAVPMTPPAAATTTTAQ